MKNPKRYFVISQKAHEGYVFASHNAMDTYLSFDPSADRYPRADFILTCEVDEIPIFYRNGKDVGSKRPAVKGEDY